MNDMKWFFIFVSVGILSVAGLGAVIITQNNKCRIAYAETNHSVEEINRLCK